MKKVKSGAGILGSPFEMNYAVESQAKYHDLDFEKMQTAYYDFTSLSTNYFVADSIDLLKKELRKYLKRLIISNPYYYFDKEKNDLISLKRTNSLE